VAGRFMVPHWLPLLAAALAVGLILAEAKNVLF
jgi:hypothetical protein